MSQDNSEAALIPIGIFAVVGVVHENADKIAQALKSFFTPILQFLGQLLLYGAIVSGTGLLVFVIIQQP
jgi:hypothetical protein